MYVNCSLYKNGVVIGFLNIVLFEILVIPHGVIMLSCGLRTLQFIFNILDGCHIEQC